MTMTLLTLLMDQARRHPALWDAETKLRKVCDWAKSWERGTPALQQKLERHAAAVAGMLGQSAEGWLAKLDEPVRRRLLSDGRRYNGRELSELLRAVRQRPPREHVHAVPAPLRSTTR